jgi:hypothetical protein
MDQDDIMEPDRLLESYRYLHTHPEIQLLGTWAQVIRSDGSVTDRFHRHPTHYARLLFQCQFDSCFVHPSVIFRKSVWEELGGYSVEEDRQPEDYEFWCRILLNYRAENLPKVLLRYRETPNGLSRQKYEIFQKNMLVLSKEYVEGLLGRKDLPSLELYIRLGREEYLPLSFPQFLQVGRLMIRSVYEIFRREPSFFFAILPIIWPIWMRMLVGLKRGLHHQ